MQKKSSSPISTILLGIFWFILTINTTFNWGSNTTLFFWLLFTILVGWFVVSIQGRTHRI
ncbi:MAG TPA: hypothetical protein VK856_09095 [Anaerolineaceae bacterium]|nr:hypothetical protein [Anaerolineaceae bacterium]